MLKAAEIVFPEKRQAFANISLTRNTVADRISELSADLDSQLKCKVESFRAFSVGTDESTNIRDVAQLAIFICGGDEWPPLQIEGGDFYLFMDILLHFASGGIMLQVVKNGSRHKGPNS